MNNTKKIYVADRLTGIIIEECKSIVDGEQIITRLEEEAKKTGFYEEDSYELVDEENISLQALFFDLEEKALMPDSTKEDRMALLDWFQSVGNCFWNGEGYSLSYGSVLYKYYSLYPIYTEVAKGEFAITDAEVR